MIKEFRDFLLRGNLVELAVAFVMGLAFAALVASFVDDLIRLDQTFFTGLPTGTLAAGRFYSADGATQAGDLTDRIIYDSAGGNLYFDADGSGAGSAPILFAILTGAPTLAAADFSVIA